ncbi:hypothetical protein RI129_011766 [Pyrocoelia pectoralis]|uniref:Uncharacterized protein n=1 Tax=Pyrocoelia pectoralis TaxID=417401 RepID=A0AAN7V9F7_9COLE
MNKRLAKLTELLTTNVEFEEVQNVIEMVIDSLNFSDITAFNETVIPFINKLVLKSNLGFKLLCRIIHKLPQEVILPHSQQWLFRIIFKDTMNIDNMELIYYFLQRCTATQDLDKFFHTHVLKITYKCMEVCEDENLLTKAPELLSICIKKYPKVCRGAVGHIQTYLHHCFGLDAPNCVIQNVGKVFCSMHKMSDSSENAWTELFQKLCATLHTVYDEFFMAGTEYSSYKQPSNVDPYRIEISPNKIGTILNNTVIFLNCMLSNEIGIQKKVCLQDLLNVIVRGLAVDTYEKCEESILMYNFTTKLYELQVGLTYLLRSAIFSYKKRWLPFAAKITKVILDCLQRCRKKFFKSNWTYQKAVYETLCEWLLVINANVEVKNQEIILQNILLDISPNIEWTSFDSEQDTATTTKSPSENDLLVKEIVCEHALETACVFLSFVDLEANKKILDDFFSSFVENFTMIYSEKKRPFTTPKCDMAIRKLHSVMFRQPYYCKTDFIQRATGAVDMIKYVNAGKDIYDMNSAITFQNLCTRKTVTELTSDKEPYSISVTNSDDPNLSFNTNHNKMNVPDLEVRTESKECEQIEHRECVESSDIHHLNCEEISGEPPNKKTKTSQDDNGIMESSGNSDIKINNNEVNLLNSSHIDESYVVENESENSDSDNENCLNSFHNTLHDL